MFAPVTERYADVVAPGHDRDSRAYVESEELTELTETCSLLRRRRPMRLRDADAPAAPGRPSCRAGPNSDTVTQPGNRRRPGIGNSANRRRWPAGVVLR